MDTLYRLFGYGSVPSQEVTDYLKQRQQRSAHPDESETSASPAAGSKEKIEGSVECPMSDRKSDQELIEIIGSGKTSVQVDIEVNFLKMIYGLEEEMNMSNNLYSQWKKALADSYRKSSEDKGKEVSSVDYYAEQQRSFKTLMSDTAKNFAGVATVSMHNIYDALIGESVSVEVQFCFVSILDSLHNYLLKISDYMPSREMKDLDKLEAGCWEMLHPKIVNAGKISAAIAGVKVDWSNPENWESEARDNFVEIAVSMFESDYVGGLSKCLVGSGLTEDVKIANAMSIMSQICESFGPGFDFSRSEFDPLREVLKCAIEGGVTDDQILVHFKPLHRILSRE